ncbi:hypothetical protein V5F61_02040, partial [Xanthobacter sp. V8C-5]
MASSLMAPTTRPPLGWQHAFGATTPEASVLFAGGALPFSIAGAPVALGVPLLGAGAVVCRAKLSATYSGADRRAIRAEVLTAASS